MLKVTKYITMFKIFFTMMIISLLILFGWLLTPSSNIYWNIDKDTANYVNSKPIIKEFIDEQKTELQNFAIPRKYSDVNKQVDYLNKTFYNQMLMYAVFETPEVQKAFDGDFNFDSKVFVKYFKQYSEQLPQKYVNKLAKMTGNSYSSHLAYALVYEKFSAKEIAKGLKHAQQFQNDLLNHNLDMLNKKTMT